MELSLSKCNATGKTRYTEPGTAKEALIRIKAKSKIFYSDTQRRQKRRAGKPEQCRIYYCKHCKGYHLTSMSAAPKQKKEQKNFSQRIKNTKGLVRTQQESDAWKATGLPFPENFKINIL